MNLTAGILVGKGVEIGLTVAIHCCEEELEELPSKSQDSKKCGYEDKIWWRIPMWIGDLTVEEFPTVN